MGYVVIYTFVCAGVGALWLAEPGAADPAAAMFMIHLAGCMAASCVWLHKKGTEYHAEADRIARS